MVARHEEEFEWIPGSSLKVPKGSIIVDRDTGEMGTPGSFHGPNSVNGMPLNPQSLSEFMQEITPKVSRGRKRGL
ncbi:MAG TPA: hypothetical protein VF189_03025 [Patescibacteria group bacterium]